MISCSRVTSSVALFLVFSSNLLNYISIGTTVWSEDASVSIWKSCVYPLVQNNNPTPNIRAACFGSVPPVLIGLGTSFNCLSLISTVVAMIIFRKKYVMIAVGVALGATLLSLLFNSTGWYFTFIPQYQQLNGGGLQNNNYLTPTFKYGWSFWLMTPSFAFSILASLAFTSLMSINFELNKRRHNAAARNGEIKS